jgi:uncharacterized protein involved in exopolysaccharide biosynthesis
MLSMLATVLRRARLIVVCMGVGALALVVPLLLKPRMYEVYASFMPQSRRAPGNMSGLAAQLGINFPQTEGGQSPQFYMELLKSSEMLRNVVTFKFDLPDDQGRRHPGTLVDRERLETPKAGDALLLQNAITRLRDRIAVSVSSKTGLVGMSVREEDPVLARDIAAKLIAELNRFNLETRQSQAASERRFTEQRLAAATAELRAAEDRRQQFNSQNRGFGDASWLALQRERLGRAVSDAQQVYSMLLTAYEQSKIEEVRDTPVITVIEPPRVPATPVSRGLAIRGILGLFVGFVIGVLIALVSARMQVLRAEGAPGWLELESIFSRGARKDARTAAGHT